MKKYEVLEHKADLKIRIFGKSKKELFLNALLAMNFGLRPEILDGKSVKRKIKAKALDLSALLVDFLSEALYLTQAKKEIYESVNFIKFADLELEVEIFGKKTKKFGEDIKAVTYHNLKIIKNKNDVWQATVLFDV